MGISSKCCKFEQNQMNSFLEADSFKISVKMVQSLPAQGYFPWYTHPETS